MGERAQVSEEAVTAIATLSVAMGSPEQAARAQHLLPEDDSFVSADEIVSLSGENERVHELMSDEQIVLVLTQEDGDQPSSDERDPECEECTTTA
jgi:hypothetical protein